MTYGKDLRTKSLWGPLDLSNDRDLLKKTGDMKQTHRTEVLVKTEAEAQVTCL
jgi:hypothetical protein